MHVLVVGGLGYIGRHVVHSLLKEGYEVTTLDRKFPTANLFKKEKFLYGDVTSNLHCLAGDLEGVEVIIHLAAMIDAPQSVRLPLDYYRVNFTGTLNVLELARLLKVRGFIFASSAAVYGSDSPSPHREDTAIMNPENPYGGSKLFGERLVKDACGDKIGNICFRFFNVVGSSPAVKAVPSLTSGLFCKVITSIISGEAMSVYGKDHPTKDGFAVRDFINVQDIASAVVRGVNHLQNKFISATFNLGTGKGFSVGEVLDASDHVKYKSVVKYFVVPRRVGEVSHSVASVDKICKDWGWYPRYSDSIVNSLKEEFDARIVQQ